MVFKRKRAKKESSNQSTVYFRSRRRTGRSSFKRGVVVGFYLILIIFLFYAVFYSPLFKIKSLVITGSKTISAKDVERVSRPILDKHLWYIIPNNLLLLDKAEIKEAVLNRFPRIDSIEIKKRIPNSLKIEIEEKRSLVSWCREIIFNGEESEKKTETTSCYLVDGNGIAYQKLDESDSQLSSLPTVEEDLTNPIVLGEPVADSVFISFILKVKDIVPRFTDLKIIKFSTPSPQSRELHFTTNEGWRVYLDSSRSAEEQIRILNKLLQEKITPEERANLEYIDLRIENRAYYK